MARTTKNEYVYKGDFTVLRITSRTHGVFDFKIDNDDVDKCKMFHWSINKYYGEGKGSYYYASNNKIGLLHRYITGVSKGMVVDHINGITLDNRKENLQVCKQCENIRKQNLRYDNKSGCKGVFWYKPSNKWMAYIKVNRKRIHIGYFSEFDDAVNARRNAEIKYFGEFATTN